MTHLEHHGDSTDFPAYRGAELVVVVSGNVDYFRALVSKPH